MCFRLKKTPQELRAMVTSSEFLLLEAYLDKEWDDNSKQDYYLAQIATVIERFQEGFQDNPRTIRIEDKLIGFGMKKVLNPKEEEEVEDKPVESVDFDKQFWLARLGLNIEEGPK